ncbi:MAG TPA: glycogen synthase [Verrucomicrobiae bacterium]|nr:glycogen synthase [Verrucomicrobiae bacterium]
MKILFAASEMTPFAKTGGLGDVVGALPIELAELGHEVICCVPYYRSVREFVEGRQSHSTEVEGAGRQTAATESGGHTRQRSRGQGDKPPLQPTGVTFKIPLGGQTVTGEVMESNLRDNLRVVFVRRDEFFDRSELYHTGVRDYEDNAERFLFFSKAVAELSAQLRPGVVHCHDWQTAFVPVEMRYRHALLLAGQETGAGLAATGTVAPPGIETKTVFTIHNLAYQGMFPGGTFGLTNLPAEFFTPEGLEFYGQLNLMKGGILFADAVTTVSPTYAQEIQTPPLGFGLDPVLHSRKGDVVGILNGVDDRQWDPATDRLLKQRYSADGLEGKRVCKVDLLRRMNLDINNEETTPVAAFISRLTDQKGVDVLAEAASGLLRLGVTLVMLVKGERRYETLMMELAAKHPHQVSVKIALDEELSHQMQAGADLLLVPSKFEPCGLTQMYALKYGTVPVVHDTGGLHDTVEPFDVKTARGHGFRFAEYSARALVAAVAEAVEVYRQPRLWERLQKNAMACDFSWRASAKQYVKLYESL